MPPSSIRVPSSTRTRTRDQEWRIGEIKSCMKAPNRLVSESVDEKTGAVFLDFSHPSRDCLFRIAVDRKGNEKTSYLRWGRETKMGERNLNLGLDSGSNAPYSRGMVTYETTAAPRLQETGSVPPQSLSLALEHIAAGGVLAVPSYSRWIIIDAKTVAKFEKVGQWLIKEEGNCYRIRQGKGSVCILPGQLKFTRYQTKEDSK